MVTELKEHMIRAGHVVASELHKCPHCPYTHHKQNNIKQHINRQGTRWDFPDYFVIEGLSKIKFGWVTKGEYSAKKIYFFPGW